MSWAVVVSKLLYSVLRPCGVQQPSGVEHFKSTAFFLNVDCYY